MTLKPYQIKTVIATTSILLVTFTLSPELIGNAYATHCNSSTHCYSVGQRTPYTDGNKVTLAVPSLTSDCSHFVVVPNWVIFNSAATDWVEVGIGEGALGNCYTSETIYSYVSINGGGGWGTHGSATVGSTLTFSLDDSSTNTTWVIKKDTSTLRTATSSFSNGWDEVGAEMTYDSGTIALTHLYNISYYSGGWNLWTSNVSLPTPSSGMWRTVCLNYHHIHVGTGTAQAC